MMMMIAPNFRACNGGKEKGEMKLQGLCLSLIKCMKYPFNFSNSLINLSEVNLKLILNNKIRSYILDIYILIIYRISSIIMVIYSIHLNVN